MSEKCKQCGGEIPFTMAQIGGVHLYCETLYFQVKDQLMIKMRPAECGGEWLVVAPTEVADVLINGDENEDWEIRMSKMSKGEIENLPEHGGW